MVFVECASALRVLVDLECLYIKKIVIVDLQATCRFRVNVDYSTCNICITLHVFLFGFMTTDVLGQNLLPALEPSTYDRRFFPTPRSVQQRSVVSCLKKNTRSY